MQELTKKKMDGARWNMGAHSICIYSEGMGLLRHLVL